MVAIRPRAGRLRNTFVCHRVLVFGMLDACEYWHKFVSVEFGLILSWRQGFDIFCCLHTKNKMQALSNIRLHMGWDCTQHTPACVARTIRYYGLKNLDGCQWADE